MPGSCSRIRGGDTIDLNSDCMKEILIENLAELVMSSSYRMNSLKLQPTLALHICCELPALEKLVRILKKVKRTTLVRTSLS